jgi:RHS repeat-associated protein
MGRVRRSTVGRLLTAALTIVLAAMLIDVVATPTKPALAATDPGGGEYVPLTPARIVDTRTGQGGYTGTLGVGVTKSFTVTGTGGVPSSGVSAVVLSVTGVGSTGTTYLAVYPSGESRPDVTQVSLDVGDTVANTVIAKVGTGGKVDVWNHAGSVSILLDVQGYFTDNTVTTAGGTYVALSPARIVDTRTGLGGSSTRVGSQETRNVTVLGVGGVPTSGVSAVALNITAVGPTASTYVTAFPAGTTRPDPASTLNTLSGVDIASLAQVKVGTGGQISVYVNAGSLDLVVDVEGYYLDSTQTGRDLYVPVSPRRVYDNRTAMTPGSTRVIQATGAKDLVTGNVVVPSAGVTAVVLSVTAVTPGASGHMDLFPDGTLRPTISTLNFTAGDAAVTGTVIAKVGTGGRVDVYDFNATPGLILDVQGYFQSVSPGAPPAPTVTSSTYPSNAWTPGSSSGSFTFNSSSSTVSRYLYAVDDPTLASASSAATSNGAAVTVSITPGDGWHTLSVRSVDFANNLSTVSSYSFGTTPGVTLPKPDGRTSRFLRLDALAKPGYTGVTWQYRRAEADAWANIPVADVTVSGSAVGSWPVTVPSGTNSDAPELSWDVPRTVNGADGTVSVRACFTDATTTACSTVAVTATLDQHDLGNASATGEVGPGTVSLLSGNYAVTGGDVSIDSYGSDLSMARTFNTLEPDAAPAGAAGQLDANQAETESGVTGFTAFSVALAATTPAATGAAGLKLTPNGTSSTNVNTFATIGSDYGNGMQLGMRAGHTYTFSTWEYVPAATGLSGISSTNRVMRAVLFYKVGTSGSYVEVDSNAPTATDTWQQVRLRATLPAGTTEAFIRLHNGLASNATTKWVAYDHSALSEEGIFGPGWVTSLPVDAASADWTGLTDRGSAVAVTDADGVPLTFAKKTDGSYAPTGEDATSGLSLTAGSSGSGGPADYTVADLDGNSTVFTPAATYSTAASTTGPHTYHVARVVQPGSNQTTTYSYDTEGRVVQELAPLPPGVSSCTTWQAGCKALQLAYNSAGHLTAVTFRTTTAAGAELKVDVACYGYDDATGGTGRLLQVWDPRLVSGAGSGTQPVACDAANPVLPTTYTYDGSGRLASITPAGLAGWALGYDTSGRLHTVARTHDSAHGGGTETTTVEYDAPRTVDSGNTAYRPDLSTTTAVAAWGQTDVPATATAVFNPGHTSSRTDLRGSEVSYLNADGRTVNTATYGSGGWAITTAAYDQWGNTARTLSAANRDAVLGNAPSSALDLIAAPDATAKALALSSISVYTVDGQNLTDTYGPYQLVTLPDGRQVGARSHTHNAYDTGTETGHPTGPLLHLIIQTTTAASLSADPVATDEQDTRTTHNDYALSTSDATGWTYRQPMRVTTDPGGIASSTVTRYDIDSGLVIESRMPSEPNGGGPGTTVTIYYTAGTNSADAACSNKPAWANLVCVTTPANPDPGVAGLPQLVLTRTSAYDYLNRPATVDESVVDAAGTTRVRTTTTTYDNSGYSPRMATTSLAGGLGTAVPAATSSYDTITGLATKVTAGTTSASTGYDDFGRITTYTDADEATGSAANQTTTTYDTAGRVATVTDAHGTVTYTYNQNGETRDLATSMAVSGISGTFSASYDSDGRLASQAWPNGLQQTTTVDATAQTTSLIQTLGDSIWLSETVSPSIHGQTRTHTYTGAAAYAGTHTYTYDNLGRLTQATDTTVTDGCTTRTYAFNANTNRTSKTVYSPVSGGACQTSTGTATSYGYDTADRLTPTGSHTGTAYDAYGRITTLPAADATAGTGDVNVGYFANDMVRTQTQNGTTLTYTLDAAGRLRTWTNSTTAVTKTNHYDDASGDSPDWISETTDHSQWTRNITDLSGNLAATLNQAGTLTWQVTNLHGDTVATAASGATEPDTYYRADEYGLPVGTAAIRYGWLGGKQRSTDDLAGLVLMGLRLYNPLLGRFLQTDPVAGGSANDYDYCTADPINCYDLDGRWGWKKFFKRAASFVGTVSTYAGYIPFCSFCAAVSAATGLLSSGLYAAGGDYASARRQLISTAVGVALGGFGSLRTVGRAGKVGRRLLRSKAIRGFNRWGRKTPSLSRTFGRAMKQNGRRGRVAHTYWHLKYTDSGWAPSGGPAGMRDNINDIR